MRVALFSDCYLPTKNGVVTSLRQLRQGLEQQGHEVLLVVPRFPGQATEERDTLALPSIGFNRLIAARLSLPAMGRAVREIRIRGIDLIHTHTEFSLGWLGKLIAQREHLPWVHTAHTLWREYRHYLVGGRHLPEWVIQAILKTFIHHCDTLVCPSERIQHFFQKLQPNLPACVVGNGIDSASFHPAATSQARLRALRHQLGIGRNDKVIIFVGRFSEEKRVLELYEVLRRVLHLSPSTKALLVGEGSQRQELERRVRGDGLWTRVIFTGWVPWEHLPAYYQLSDLMLTVSLSEVHPVTLIEAVCSGLAIVARGNEGGLNMVRDGKNGFVCASDEAALERTLQLLMNSGQLEQLKSSSLDLAPLFDAKIHCAKMEKLYQKLLRIAD